MKLAIVQTRKITNAAGNGREYVLSFIRAALAEGNDVTPITLHDAFEYSRLACLFRIGANFLRGLLEGEVLPLQCLLFSDRKSLGAVAQDIADGGYDAVYLDSVRSYPLLKLLRKKMVKARLIVDFDDLMSRRMKNLRESRYPISLGYLRERAEWAQWLAQVSWISRAISAYEAYTLRTVEHQVVRIADAVVILSPVENAMLRKRVGPLLAAKVHSILPPTRIAQIAGPRSLPVRFCFIGSGTVIQNRQTILYLLDIWRRHRPAAELHIVGRQPTTPDVRNVVWRGYVEDLKDVYDAHSVSLSPSFMKGGIKTKVIEAFAYGCPVVGNATSFESLKIAGYPLKLDHDSIVSVIMDPQAWQHKFALAAALGQQFAAQNLTVEAHNDSWRHLIHGDAVAAAQTVPA